MEIPAGYSSQIKINFKTSNTHPQYHPKKGVHSCPRGVLKAQEEDLCSPGQALAASEGEAGASEWPD
jgi:hypothetical protein